MHDARNVNYTKSSNYTCRNILLHLYEIFYCIYNAASKLSDRDAEIERGGYITNCARDTRFIINHHPTLTTYNIM